MPKPGEAVQTVTIECSNRKLNCPRATKRLTSIQESEQERLF